MPWKADLREHETGRLTERLETMSPARAEAHFRSLLRMSDLIGQRYAARLVSPISRRSIYFSRFDRDLGNGRIHPDAPLDLSRLNDGTKEASAWTPSHNKKGSGL